MKKFMIPLFFALAALALAFSSSASAAEGKTMTPQQEKMATCSHESKGLKGEEHKKFMSDCLKGKTHEMKTDEAAAAGAATTAKSKAHEATEKAKHSTSAEREKMKTCEADAKSKKLKGKARKDSIGECMKGGA
ncbi:MAG: PsiF family protein [Gammaproteobacteria bacterium]